MARSAPSFDPATQKALCDAAMRLDREFGHDTKALLDRLILDTYDVTRSVHSAKTYLRLLSMAGITRQPSESTVQRAIARMRARLGPACTVPMPPATQGAVFVAEDAVHHLATALALLSTNIFDAVETRTAVPSHPQGERLLREQLERENRALRMYVERVRAQMLSMSITLAELLNANPPCVPNDKPRGARA